jgi:hypothetical protein
MTAWVEFIRWPYDDEAGHFVVRASDGSRVAEQEFYAYPADLATFGAALAAFPRDRADEAKLEIGNKDAGHADWVCLRAYLHDAAGHAALLVDVASNGTDPWRSEARFTIRCEVASLNGLGRMLAAWARSNEHGTFRHELHSGG